MKRKALIEVEIEDNESVAAALDRIARTAATPHGAIDFAISVAGDHNYGLQAFLVMVGERLWAIAKTTHRPPHRVMLVIGPTVRVEVVDEHVRAFE